MKAWREAASLVKPKSPVQLVSRFDQSVCVRDASLLVELCGAGKRILNARTNVQRANVALEFGLLHELCRLLTSAAQE